jgi:hypothetical protein
MEINETDVPQSSGPPGYWRAATIFCLLLLVLGGTAGWSMFEQFTAQVLDLQQKVQRTAQLQYVAVLLDVPRALGLIKQRDEARSSINIPPFSGSGTGVAITEQIELELLFA